MTTQTSNPDRTVPARRISFEESLQDLPKHFAADGDLISSHLVAGLSALFPDGEDFFVRSVRHYRKHITDPALKIQVKGFIGQEALHGREHRLLNDRLAELGYPTRAIEKQTRIGLGIRERIAPAKANLALTTALEHFTATLAEALLTDEHTRSMVGHPEVQNLFVWHALEESEHKAVAFDVYKAVGGTERMRVWTMQFLRFGFPFFLAVQTLISLLMDRSTYRPGRLRKSWKSFRASPMLSKAMWDQLRDYNRPDFHPDDRDTTGLVEEWRTRLFGPEGTLNDKLDTKAA